MIEKVAKALDYLHTEKLLMHGDLKSGNVLIVGDFNNVKLCDFGVTLPLNSEGVVSEPDRNSDEYFNENAEKIGVLIFF